MGARAWARINLAAPVSSAKRAFEGLLHIERWTMLSLSKTYQLVLTAILLQFLACQCSATQVEEDDGMPPGTSLGDHTCIHDKVFL